MEQRYKYKVIIDNELKDVHYFYPAYPDDEDLELIFVCTNFEESIGCIVNENQLIQCTGIKDMKGNWIWEGDILKTSSGKARVVWFKGEFKLQVINCFVPWDTTEQYIIGNILDKIEEN